MPEDRLALGAFAAMPDLRPCRLLRQLRPTGTRPSIFTATGHPIIEGYDPPEGWGWCYVDEVMIDLGERHDAA